MKTLKLFFLLFVVNNAIAQPPPPPGPCFINAFQVSGGGTYCGAGDGLPIYLNASQTNHGYQLRKDGVNIGDPVYPTVFGQPINFGNQTQAGVYTVVAFIVNEPLCGVALMNGSATIYVNELQQTPVFDQIAPICQGETGVTLPLISNNGITGTWSPTFNNNQTTTYFFTPNDGQCSSNSTSLTVEVNSTLPPTGEANQNFNYDATVSNLAAIGANIKWYISSTGGTELSSSLSLINGTTYYASQTINNCESQDRLAVLANVAAAPTGITNVVPGQCGVTLASTNSYIYANLVPNAQAYRFRITRLDTNQILIKESVLRNLSLASLSIFKYDQEYKIEVAVKRNNVWETYGVPCTISTPVVTTKLIQSHCDNPILSQTSTLLAENVTKATGYRFRVVNTLTNSVQIINRSLRSFPFTLVSDFSPNTVYNIDVSVRNTDGTYLPYGDICTVVYNENSNKTIEANPTNEISITAYPNPFEDYFNILIDTNNTNEILFVKVYDAIGRQIDSKEISSDKENTIKIGDGYPTGVYSVIVTVNETTKSFRMIKR